MAGERMSRAFLGTFNPAFQQGVSMGYRQYGQNQQLEREQKQNREVAGVLSKTPEFTRYEDWANAVDMAQKSGDISGGFLMKLLDGKVSQDMAKAQMAMGAKKQHQTFLTDVAREKRIRKGEAQDYDLGSRRLDLDERKLGMDQTKLKDTRRGDAQKNTLANLDQIQDQFWDQYRLMNGNQGGASFNLNDPASFMDMMSENRDNILNTEGMHDALLRARVAQKMASDVRQGVVPEDYSRIIGSARMGRGQDAISRMEGPFGEQFGQLLQQMHQQRGGIYDEQGNLTEEGSKIASKAILDQLVNDPVYQEQERLRALFEGRPAGQQQSVDRMNADMVSNNRPTREDAATLEAMAEQLKQTSVR